MSLAIPNIFAKRLRVFAAGTQLFRREVRFHIRTAGEASVWLAGSHDVRWL